ncbi:hypothetical protein K1719_004489 [Acacia pycnantha]|nr:hypothetical protein K1719_004489 [Acacia pycnantha]
MEEPIISDPLIWKENIVEKILIGKIMSSKSYSRVAIERILQKAWNLQSGLDVIEVTGNTFMFRFSDVVEYSRILRGRLWSINGCLLNLMERSKYNACEDFEFNRCPVWIQVHNIPVEAMCLENAIMIGGYVGEVVLVEDPYLNGKLYRNFLRARVSLDLRKPLPYGFWMKKPDCGRIWTSIRYEKLQSFCFSCGKIGHDNRTCNSEKWMSVAISNEPCFGPWTTTNQCRNCEESVVVVRQNWEEADYFRKRKEEALARRRKDRIQEVSRESKRMDEDLFFIKLNKSSSLERKEDSAANLGDYSLSAEDCDASDRELEERCGSQTHTAVPQVAVMASSSGVDAGEVSKAVSSSDPNLPSSLVEVVGARIGSKTPEVAVGTALAMVPYCGNSLLEVTNVLCGLGLKRSAVTELDLPCLKRRKMDVVEPDHTPNAISTYARDLRKSKARLRRSGKRKDSGEKENTPMVELSVDELMDEPTTSPPLDQVFVFKAKSVGSDHHVLLVDCCYTEVYAVREFKFEANWVLHEDFLKIVKGSWLELAGVSDDHLLDLVLRMNICRERLKE